jgi:hypothetical protein
MERFPRCVLSAAAVIGRTFDLKTLAAVAGVREHLGQLLGGGAQAFSKGREVGVRQVIADRFQER